MYFITTKRMLEVCFSAHPNIQYRTAGAAERLDGMPNAEVYVFEEYGEIQGFVGMDAEYIAGLFVVEGHQGHGTGHQLISEVKRKNRLSLHAYEKNAGAVAFYQAEGFHIENSMTEKETGEQEYRMVFHESDESKESCSK